MDKEKKSVLIAVSNILGGCFWGTAMPVTLDSADINLKVIHAHSQGDLYGELSPDSFVVMMDSLLPQA